MPYSDPIRQKEAKRKSYLLHKEKYTKKQRDTRVEYSRRVAEMKTDCPCKDCGVVYPYYVMDYDHRPGEEKIGNISRLIRMGKWEQVLVEIEKCDLVCANCHRIRTWSRLPYGGIGVMAAL